MGIERPRVELKVVRRDWSWACELVERCVRLGALVYDRVKSWSQLARRALLALVEAVWRLRRLSRHLRLVIEWVLPRVRLVELLEVNCLLWLNVYDRPCRLARRLLTSQAHVGLLSLLLLFHQLCM